MRLPALPNSVLPKDRGTPAEILAHIGDLFDWGLSLANGQQRWRLDATRVEQQIARFFDAIRKLDERLGAAEPLACPAENLFQGPIADALTHIGQIAMLRRLAGGTGPRGKLLHRRYRVRSRRTGAETSEGRVRLGGAIGVQPNWSSPRSDHH